MKDGLSLESSWAFLANEPEVPLQESFQAGVTFAGVLLATGMLVVSLFTRIRSMPSSKRHFADEQRYDFLLRFAEPVRKGNF